MQAAIRLAVLKARAAHVLDELGLYLNEMLHQIEQARERDRQWMLNTFGGDEGPDDCAEELADIEHQYDTVFATLLTHSFVVVVYGHFEDSSTTLLNLHRDLTDQPLGLSDFRGNLVERIQRYLAGIRAEKLPDDLVSRLRTLALVRNCIAHQAGRVARSAN